MDGVTYGSAGHAARPSPIIWADCPAGQILADPCVGVLIWDDFLGGVLADASIPGWNLVGADADCDMAAGEATGALFLETGSADEDEVYITSEPFCKFDLNSGHKIWVEARIKMSSLTAAALIFGLGEEAALVADAIVDTGANLITESFIGFRIYVADNDNIDFVYQLDDGAEVESVVDTGFTVSTYTKLGFKFNGRDKVSIYQDGVLTGTLTLAAATFPNNVNMGLILGVKETVITNVKDITIDWIRAAYEYNWV